MTERRRTDGTLLGLAGLSAILARARGASAAEIVRGLHDAVIDASPKPLRDDATVLLLAPHGSRVRGPGESAGPRP